MRDNHILVTGSSGFIGSALVRRLMLIPTYAVRAASRQQSYMGLTNGVFVEDLEHDAKWSEALSGIDVVVHTAARVHVNEENSNNPLKEYRLINVEGTLNCAIQSVKAGVRRFIFISTIKVNGKSTPQSGSFKAWDIPAPTDPYGISKHEAEQALLKLARETSMEMVIIRPPLVYGPGVKANFYKMMQFLAKGFPLPLGAINNKRSLVALKNIVDLIVTCIDHPAAANQIFLAGDGEDLSTTELLQRLGVALGKPARLLPVPQKMLEFCLKLLGKDDVAQRLCGSLQADISKARDMLGWNPPVSVDEGLKRTAEWYLRQNKLKRVS